MEIVKKQVELTTIGNRKVSTMGYRLSLVLEHLDEHIKAGSPLYSISNQWCDVGCMARTMFGRNTETNRASIRARLPRTFKEFLTLGKFLVIDYEPYGKVIEKDDNGVDKIVVYHGQAKAMKLLQPNSVGDEKQYAERQINKLLNRRKLTNEQFIKAYSLVYPS